MGRVFLLFLLSLDVLLAGVAQAALALGLTAATALLGVLLSVCKIVVSHHLDRAAHGKFIKLFF